MMNSSFLKTLKSFSLKVFDVKTSEDDNGRDIEYQNTTINDLIDDCLWHVLEWLNLKEKIGVHRVCRKWQNAVSKIIQFREEKLVFQENDINSIESSQFESQQVPKRHPLHPINIAKKEVFLFNQFKFDCVEEVRILIENEKEPFCLDLSHIRWLLIELPQLDSVKLTNVYIKREIDIFCLKEICGRLRKFFVFKSNCCHFIIQLLSNDNVLEQLAIEDANIGVLEILLKKSKTLRFLKFRMIPLSNIDSVLADKPNLRKLCIEDIAFENKDLNLAFFAKFAVCPQLETLELYLKKSTENKSLLTLDCFQTMSIQEQQCISSGLKKLRRLELANFTTTPTVFETLFKLIPSIKRLSLRDIEVFCSCQESKNENSGGTGNEEGGGTGNESSGSCEKCPKDLIETLTELNNLVKLEFRQSRKNEAFVQAIAALLENGRLPKLRKFMFSFCFEESLDLLFAFCKHARSVPEKSFCVETLQTEAIREFVANQQYEKPRNLSFVSHPFL